MTEFSDLHDAWSKRWTQLSSFRALVFLLLTQSCAGAISSTVISLEGLGRTSSSVELQCKSAGWYPQPEVLWLDGEGKLLSAGPTETVRGPDDLYTVSSRVTVEKRHSNKFTCRVQQNNINQTREALIQVTDDFFQVQSSYTSTIVGLAVSLALSIILLILAVVLLVLTRRQNRKMKTLVNEKQRENQRINNQLKQEKQNKETLRSRLDEFEKKLQDEKKKWMETVRTLKTELQNINQEFRFSEPQKLLLVLTGSITLEEVHDDGDYIRLKNISRVEIDLEGWRLELQDCIDPDKYTFNESLKLKAGGILSLQHSGRSTKRPYDVVLVWSDLLDWRPTGQLQLTLISNKGETYKLL